MMVVQKWVSAAVLPSAHHGHLLPPGVEREGRAGGGGHDGPLAEGRGEEPRGGGAGGGGGGDLHHRLLLHLHRPPLLSPGRRQDQDRVPQVNSRLSAIGENWTDQKLKFRYLIFNPKYRYLVFNIHIGI